MRTEKPDETDLRDPKARLEMALIAEYLRGRGYSLESLRDLPTAEAKRLMAEASVYASVRLSEVETRADLVHEIDGSSPPL